MGTSLLNVKRKKKKRHASTADLDLFKMYGAPPVPYTGKGVDSPGFSMELNHALNWASRGIDDKEALNELGVWMLNHGFSKLEVRAVKTHDASNGSVCYKKADGTASIYLLSVLGRYAYLLNNAWPEGAFLTEEFMKVQVKVFIESGKIKIQEEDNVPEKVTVSAETQNRVKASGIVVDIEDMIFFNDTFSQAGVQELTKGAKGPVMQTVAKELKDLKTEMLLVGVNEQVTEGYSHIGKVKMKKILADLDSALLVFEGAKINKKTRMPRAKKVKSAVVQVKKFKYQEKDEKLNIVSENSANLIGALKVVTYNTKMRKIGIYHAKDEKGFTVKGAYLQDFDEKRSEQKMLRETKGSTLLDKITAFRKATIHKVDKVFEDLNTTNAKMNGKFNKDTMILKIYR